MALGTNYARNQAPKGRGGCEISRITLSRPCHRKAVVTVWVGAEYPVQLCRRCAGRVKNVLGKGI
jgi:hypothetical protein